MKKYNIKNNCSSSPLLKGDYRGFCSKGIIGESFAFTLIELLIVTTIIILMSASGVFYFLDFVKGQEISQKLLIIEDDIEELDKDVKNYNILDYELLFNTSSTGSKSYIKYINNFDTVNQKLTIDYISGTGTIKAIGTGTGIIKIYKNDKLFVSNIIDKISDYYFRSNNSQNYKITGTFSGKTLNDIGLNYFSEDNLYPEKNNNLELININTKEDKTGTPYPNIEIINIGGNKKIGNNESEIYLFFENNGKEKFIKITK